MRGSIFIFLLGALTPAMAWAQDAQTAFVERRGLLEVDAHCRLFDPNVRAALQAGAGQARGQLLGGGWSRTQLDELEQTTVRAARTRACDDARTIASAEQARNGFIAWSRMNAMTFPGWERAWSARRIPDAAGWYLRQDAPGGVFGVRERDGATELALTLSTTAPPASAIIVMRDPSRARTSLIDVPGRMARGLEAGAPSHATAQRFLASARVRDAQGVSFVFPDAAFEAMARLDPREAIEIRLGEGSQAQRILIEVGDAAAARAFLALQER